MFVKLERENMFSKPKFNVTVEGDEVTPSYNATIVGFGTIGGTTSVIVITEEKVLRNVEMYRLS